MKSYDIPVVFHGREVTYRFDKEMRAPSYEEAVCLTRRLANKHSCQEAYFEVEA